jgi:Cu/Ag efflux protein CusF
MNKLTVALVITTGMIANLSLMGCADTVVEKRAAKPELRERIKQDAITGEVTDVGAKYVAIRQMNGETMRVRVDDNTKMDHVTAGDKVKAYVSDDGYASTLQRVGR